MFRLYGQNPFLYPSLTFGVFCFIVLLLLFSMIIVIRNIILFQGLTFCCFFVFCFCFVFLFHVLKII